MPYTCRIRADHRDLEIVYVWVSRPPVRAVSKNLVAEGRNPHSTGLIVASAAHWMCDGIGKTSMGESYRYMLARMHKQNADLPGMLGARDQSHGVGDRSKFGCWDYWRAQIKIRRIHRNIRR